MRLYKNDSRQPKGSTNERGEQASRYSNDLEKKPQNEILQLQKKIGNRQVMQLMRQSQNNQAGSRDVIQRAKLNIRPDKTISGVSNFPSRPTSNLRGSQGQHLTAYVTFEDMIVSQVADRTPAAAAAALVKIMDEIESLPGMQVKSGAYLLPYIKKVKEDLNSCNGDVTVIGEQIDVILSIRNKVPGTAERGTGGGHGEARSSGIVSTVEKALRQEAWNARWDEQTVANQVLESMWQLLDYDPAEPSDADELKTIVNLVGTHFISLRMAYPETFKWLSDSKFWLLPYLEKNRKGKGMPLTKLSGDTLDAVAGGIYKML